MARHRRAAGALLALALVLVIFPVLGTLPASAEPSADPFVAYVANNGNSTVTAINTRSEQTTGSPIGSPTFASAPRHIAITPNGKTAYVVGDRGLYTIDLASHAATLITSAGGWGIAITPDGKKAYVTHGAEIAVYAIGSGSSGGPTEIAVPGGGGAQGIAITPDGRTAYVAAAGTNTVVVLDTATDAILKTVPVGAGPYGVAVTSDGAKAYVTNSSAGTVTLIDVATNSAAAAIFVGGLPEDIAASPPGMPSYVYVANFGGSVESIATDVSGPVGALAIALPSGTSASGIAITPDGSVAYVSDSGSNTVIALGIHDGHPSGTAPRIAVGPAAAAGSCTTPNVVCPRGIAISRYATTLNAQASPPVATGGSVTDTATLVGGFDGTGSITFSAYATSDCSGPPVFTSSKPVSGPRAYTSDAFTPAGAGSYRWMTSYSGDLTDNAVDPSGCADPSQAVDVSDPAAPTITGQPSDMSAVAGTLVTFAASAGGSPTPAVQWQSSSDSGGSWTDVPGATSPTLSFIATDQDHQQYRAVFTNSAGTATTSAATLRVTAGPADHLILSPASTSIRYGTSQGYTAEGFDAYGNDIGDETAVASFTIATGTGPPVDCPGATCTPRAAGDYTVTGTVGTSVGTATLTVAPAPLTVQVIGSQVYRGLPTFAVAATDGLVSGDTASPTGTLACSTTVAQSAHVGTTSGTISDCSGLSGGPNYTVSYADHGFTVTPAQLTVQASSPTVPYGSATPSVTPTYAGFVSPDTPAALPTAPTCSTTINPGTPPGTYATSCGGGVASDYTFVYRQGTATVTPAATTLTSKTPLTVGAGTTFTPSATLTSLAAACQSGQPVQFSIDRNPVTGAQTPYALGTGVSGPSGDATGSPVSATGWQGGAYTLTATYAGTPSCTGSTATAPLSVSVAGQVAGGSGTYTVPGSGSVSAGFAAVRIPWLTPPTYVGSVTVINTGKWWFQGSVSVYTKSSASAGAISGTGRLSWWNPALNHGRGGWTLAANSIRYTANFTPTTRGTPGSFGVQLDYTPIAPQPSVLPNSAPIGLTTGVIGMT
jgi:YVTN family beta-propeller protein